MTTLGFAPFHNFLPPGTPMPVRTGVITLLLLCIVLSLVLRRAPSIVALTIVVVLPVLGAYALTHLSPNPMPVIIGLNAVAVLCIVVCSVPFDRPHE